MTRKLFVTTALPYANAPFHIGHMMEYIQADIWVRYQRMQGHEVHFVCADDAHGAPIMIAAEKAGTHAAGVRRRDRGRPQGLPRRLPHRVRQLALDRRPGEPRAREGDLPRAAQERADRDQGHRPVLRPGQEHVPARPLHQGRVPEVRRQGPVRRLLRGLRRGLCADRPEESVLDAVGCDAGDEEQRALLRAPVSDPRCVEFLREWTQAVGLQPEVLNKIKEWFETDEDGHGGLGDWDISRDAPYFGIEIPGCAGQVLLRLARRADRLPRVAEELLRPRRRREARRDALLRRVHGRPGDRAGPLHRQGHHLLPHAVLAGDAALLAAARRRPTCSCTASSRCATRR